MHCIYQPHPQAWERGKTTMSMRFVLVVLVAVSVGCEGLLYPRESESREVKELNGVWHFRADFSPGRNAGFVEEWYKQPLPDTGEVLTMPVPSSFNDITQNSSIRDYIGWVWYDREFWVPKSWTDNKTRIMLRFESAHYNSIAWVNGEQVANHSGGHLPFEGEITNLVKTGTPTRVTVAINNTLTPHTLPPGTLSFHGPPSYPDNYFVQNLQFDFFNYAGLHRPVKLYTTPKEMFVDDITVVTTLQTNGSATVDYKIEINKAITTGVSLTVDLKGRIGKGKSTSVARDLRKLAPCKKREYCDNTIVYQGSLHVADPHLWWPWTMSDEPTYLYVLEVTALTEDGVEDMYRLPVGIRTVSFSDSQFFINGKPFYFMGFGKHEDADIRGKGLDYPLIMKDVNLIKWIGANSFRTSHYPYAEELMELCDQHGIVVIDESPAVGLHYAENFAEETLQHHIEVMHELIQRDKNRPSVVMWSMANEPASNLPEAQPYFKVIANVTRTLDPTRPITFACSRDYNTDLVTQFVDVIAINRYYSWYSDSGHPEVVYPQLSTDLNNWYATHAKPMMLTEYGAGTVAGLHEDPPMPFTEDYQLDVLQHTFDVFDAYRDKFLVGEMIWNFADFQTGPSSNRVNGNKKGILTRQRQPKAAARLLRQRYLSIAQGKEMCYDGFSDQYHCERVYHND